MVTRRALPHSYLWLQLSVVGVALAYYTASGYLATLAGDVADQFRQGLGLVFVDLSVMALWNQVWGKAQSHHD